MGKTALIIGNSDGIGLAFTRELLKRDWRVSGISRSESPIEHSLYRHIIAEVQSPEYPGELDSFLEQNAPIDLCVYCAGIGELLDLYDMEREAEIFEVNLMGLVKTATKILPLMAEHGKGQFIGLSSLADEMLSPEAPSYHASKAAFSNYLEGMALALKSKGVYVTNVRFGFVDTKMAKGDVRPFMMNCERASRHLLRCLEKKSVRYTAPRIVIPLVKLRKWMLRLSTR